MREHYDNFSIQPIELIRSAGLGFFSGNAVKYITRHPHKNGVEDLKKAIWYLNYLLDNGVQDYTEQTYEADVPAYIKANRLGPYEAQAITKIVEWRLSGYPGLLQDAVKSIETLIQRQK